MVIERVHAVFFSATGTTKRVVEWLTGVLAEQLGCGTATVDFTLPAARQKRYVFGPADLVVFGVPTYAGRVPNLLLPFMKSGFLGNGALAVPVVLFGNRNFDDALIELRDCLQNSGFCTVAAGAFVGEHAFSRTLAAGRPDASDHKEASDFAVRVARKVQALSGAPACPVAVDGCSPIRPYYTPRDRNGTPINILKVKPKTSDACDRCGICARICPMGSIDPADPTVVNGVCIKCGACVKGCPRGAKYYDDPGYLYHQHELEDQYARPAKNSLFV